MFTTQVNTMVCLIKFPLELHNGLIDDEIGKD